MDNLRAFDVPFFFVKKLGMWQDKNCSLTYRLYGVCLHLILMEFATVCHSVHMLSLFMNGTIKDLSEVLGLIFTLYAAVLKSVWFLIKLEKIKELLEKLKFLLNFSTFEQVKRPKLKAQVDQIIKVSNYFYGSSFLVITSATIASLIHHKEKALPFNSWYFFELNTKGTYWAYFAYQCFTSLHGIAINYSLDIIPMVFMNFVSAILDELSEEIARCCDSKQLFDSGEKDYEKLQKCIECHIMVNELAKDVSKHLTFPFLVQAFMSSVILCATAFSLSTVSIF